MSSQLSTIRRPKSIFDFKRLQYCNRGLLAEETARSFKRMMDANPRFTNVEIERVRSGWRVFFRPLPLGKVYERELRMSEIRAAQEFEITPLADGTFAVYSVKSETYYTVTLGSCTCPSFVHAKSKVGAPCKHMVAVEA